MLEIASSQIIRDICSDIRTSQLFAILVDGTTDINICEQESILIGYVDIDSLSPEEAFLGFYNMTNGTSAEAISKGYFGRPSEATLIRKHAPWSDIRWGE